MEFRENAGLETGPCANIKAERNHPAQQEHVPVRSVRMRVRLSRHLATSHEPSGVDDAIVALTQ